MSNPTAACMVISDDIYAMLLTHAKFKEFTSKDIADATKTAEVLVALSAESKEKANEIVDKSHHDLDGHIWEFLWMDPSFVQK